MCEPIKKIKQGQGYALRAHRQIVGGAKAATKKPGPTQIAGSSLVSGEETELRIYTGRVLPTPREKA